MAIAPLFALALLAAQVEGGASASVTSQIGPAETSNDTTVVEPGVFIGGALSLSVEDPLEGAQLIYSPRLTLGNGQDTQLLHQGTLSGSLRASASQTFKLSESISYGDQDFSPLAPLASGSVLPPPIDRLPANEVLRIFNSGTALGYSLALSPFMKLSASAGFAIGGGLGAEARAELPLQRTSTLGGAFSWSLSKIDQLALSLNGSLSDPAADERAEALGASFSWAHVVSSATSTSLQLGAAYLHNEGPSDVQQQPVVPTGAASITHSELLGGQKLGLSLVTGAAPAIDPLSGAAYLRGSLTGTASWSPLERLALSLSVAGAHGIGAGEQHDWGATASVSASLRIPPSASASLGFRSAWLPPAEGIGEVSGYQWTAFASIAWGDTHSF